MILENRDFLKRPWDLELELDFLGEQRLVLVALWRHMEQFINTKSSRV